MDDEQMRALYRQNAHFWGTPPDPRWEEDRHCREQELESIGEKLAALQAMATAIDRSGTAFKEMDDRLKGFLASIRQATPPTQEEVDAALESIQETARKRES